jgi:transcriptional regulator with XRE-family HTH domain
VDERVALDALPDQQRRPPAGPQRGREVGEGGHRVVEEHHAVAADDDVRGRRREGVHLGVGAGERDRVEVLGRRAGARQCEHRPGQVDPVRVAGRAGPPGGGAGRPPGAAAHVQDALTGADRGRGLQHGVVGGHAAVEPVGVLGPEPPRLPVPGLLLRRVHGRRYLGHARILTTRIAAPARVCRICKGRRVGGHRGDDGRVSAEVGARLRGFRRDADLSLADVAALLGVSISTVSRLETGRRAPTLDLLLPLARRYRLTLDDLVGAPATADPRTHPRPQSRGGMTALPLHLGPGLKAFKNVLAAGPPDARIEARSHPGYHWLYVLDGALRVVLGDDDFPVRAGESFEIADTRVPHGFGNAEPAPVEFISILSGTPSAIRHRRTAAEG